MASEKDIRHRFWEEMVKSPFLMVGLNDDHQHSLPMTAQLDKDANSEFWFYASRDNRLANGGAAMAQFVAKGHDLFACISGTLVEERDAAIIDRFWSKEVEAWYPDGRQDTNLLMLRFDLGNAEIWLADLSLKGVFKMMFGGDVRAEMQGKHAEIAL